MFNVHFIHQMAGRCGEFYRPRRQRRLSAPLVALLLLISGIENNPGPIDAGSVQNHCGPRTLNFGCINMNSVVQKGALVIDLINNLSLDALAVCETKIVNDDPAAIKRDCVPAGYDILHLPRPGATRRTRGGGICFIHRCDSLVVKRHRLQHVLKYTSFECQLLSINATRDDSTSGVTVAIIYRPPSSTAATIAEFHDELSEMFDTLSDAIDTDRFVACGDFNCGGDSPTSISTDLQTLFNTHGLQQFVQSPTRRTVKVSNLLDLVVGRVGSNCISDVAVHPSHSASDHDIVTWKLSTRTKPPRQLISFRFRSMKNVDWASLQADLQCCELHTNPANTADGFAEQLDTVVTRILDLHCPLQERRRFASTRRDNRWLSSDAVAAKRERRRLERQWRSTRNVDHYTAYRKSCRRANKIR